MAKAPNDLSKYYDKKAKEFDELKQTYLSPNNYKRFFFLTRFNRVFGMVNPKQSEVILDIGCGSGFYVKKVVGRGSKTWATEVSKVYLEQSKKYVGANNAIFILSPTSNLPFSDNFFDKIIYTEVIEHDPDYLESLKEIHRILKPNGLLIISTPSKYSPLNLAYKLKKKLRKYEFDEHVNEFSTSEFKGIVIPYFRVKKLEFVNFFVPYPLDKFFILFDHPFLISFLIFFENLLQKTPVLKYLGWTMIILATKEK